MLDKRYCMKKIVMACLFMQPIWVQAGVREYFKKADGSTNWQYLANWSSGSLIIILTGVLLWLFVVNRRAKKANRALHEIRQELEQRVLERTATLDDSNRLLKQTNQLLEGEIQQHESTSKLLRLSEGYIKDILESMPLMLIGVDKDMNVNQWNKYAQEFTGLTAEQAMGKNLWDAYPTITVSAGQIKEVLNNHKPVTIKHCQRGQYYFDITLYPLSDKNEMGIVVLIDNVTQRIMAENMLIQRDKMSSMGELAATMAHDINTPLQAILKDIQTINATIATGDQVDCKAISGLLVDAEVRGSQAIGVINNLLDFSQSQGEAQFMGDIVEVIEHSIRLAADVLSEPSGFRFRDVSIERMYQQDLPSVPCYVPELQQVFFSLFRHACQYLAKVNNRSDFKPLIRIDIMESFDALWIKVHHNGVGLSSDEQQYIFEPFFNKTDAADSLDAAERLSFSYFIVAEHHKGHMAVTSDVEAGTTFHIQLQLSVPGFNKPLQHPTVS